MLPLLALPLLTVAVSMSEPARPAKASTRAGDGEVSRERRSLSLAKARIVNELHTTANPRYRDLLGTSLAAIDQQLSVPPPA